jgi:antirestriction protein
MTPKLYAQPYDISATGFYFEKVEQYEEFAAKAVNNFGQRVEEFEIQFIDGERIDCELARAWELNQVNFEEFLESAADWDDDRKRHYIIAVSECGYGHFDVVDDPESVEIDLYSVHSLQELAEQFLEEGLFGDIPEQLSSYIDHDAIARDLAVEYSKTTIAGEEYVYACR